MTYWQRMIAPWLAWRARREYERWLACERRRLMGKARGAPR